VEFPQCLLQHVLQVVKGIPKVIEDPGVQNKDVEEESTTADIGGNNSTNITGLKVKEGVGQSYPHDTVTEVREEIGQSVSSAYWIDPASEVKEEVTPHDTVPKVQEEIKYSLPSAFMIDHVTEVKEEGGQPHDTVTEVNVGTIGSEKPSGQPDFPIDADGKRLPNTNLEDLEPDTFRKQMQETAKEDELKELSDKILYNQTLDDEDGEQAVSSTDSGGGIPNVVTETIEAVTDLAQVVL